MKQLRSKKHQCDIFINKNYHGHLIVFKILKLDQFLQKSEIMTCGYFKTRAEALRVLNTEKIDYMQNLLNRMDHNE